MGKDVHFEGKAKRNSVRPRHDEGVVKKTSKASASSGSSSSGISTAVAALAEV